MLASNKSPRACVGRGQICSLYLSLSPLRARAVVKCIVKCSLFKRVANLPSNARHALIFPGVCTRTFARRRGKRKSRFVRRHTRCSVSLRAIKQRRRSQGAASKKPKRDSLSRPRRVASFRQHLPDFMYVLTSAASRWLNARMTLSASLCHPKHSLPVVIAFTKRVFLGFANIASLSLSPFHNAKTKKMAEGGSFIDSHSRCDTDGHAREREREREEESRTRGWTLRR